MAEKNEGKKERNSIDSSGIERYEEEEEELEEKKEMELEKSEAGIEETKEVQVDLLKEQLEKTEKEYKELEDRLLRVAAEFDNYKKRTAREFQSIIKNANEELISQLVGTLDNFQRALDSAKNSGDFDSFHKGVELIYQHFKDILGKEGLKEIKAIGEPFDPHLHEAVMQQESDKFDDGIVMDEISKGYMLNDKVIKHSKVIVSKGRPEKKSGE
ncbi:MAG: nucleotide exchange factor GrpE [candidate division Zixibacteria bacterium]|nr:nucleotide exchange factor GrpE [candidate division Zixibacteria bacterium]